MYSLPLTKCWRPVEAFLGYDGSNTAFHTISWDLCSLLSFEAILLTCHFFSGAYRHIFIHASFIAILKFHMNLYKSYFCTDNAKALHPLAPWEEPSSILTRPLHRRIGKKQNLLSKPCGYGYCWLIIFLTSLCSVFWKHFWPSLPGHDQEYNRYPIWQSTAHKSAFQTKLYIYPYKGVSSLLLMHNAKITPAQCLLAKSTVPYSLYSHRMWHGLCSLMAFWRQRFQQSLRLFLRLPRPSRKKRDVFMECTLLLWKS